MSWLVAVVVGQREKKKDGDGRLVRDGERGACTRVALPVLTRCAACVKFTATVSARPALALSYAPLSNARTRPPRILSYSAKRSTATAFCFLKCTRVCKIYIYIYFDIYIYAHMHVYSISRGINDRLPNPISVGLSAAFR